MAPPRGIAAVLYNPFAGRGAAAGVAESAREALEAAGLEVAAVRPSEFAGHTTSLAAELAAGCERLVVIGGDGTLREAAEGLLSARSARGAGDTRGPAVGFVPLGNANVVARELGMPLEAAAAVRLAAEGATRPFDVGLVDGTPFLCMVGVGYDAIVADRVDRFRRTALGRALYRVNGDVFYCFIGAATLFRLAPPRCRVTADGAAIEGGFCDLLVANTATYAKGWSMAPEADPRDGLLHYQLRRGADPISVARSLRAAARRTRLPESLGKLGAARALVLEFERPARYQVDGDPKGTTRRLDITLLPGALELVTP